MKKLFTIILLSVLALTANAEDVKRIAILETVDQKGDVNLGTKVLLRQSITFGINRIPGYEAYNRVNMAQVTGEQSFQRTGYVSDADIKKLGVMTGAAYVLIAEAANYDATHILVLANLVDVETGRVTNSSIPKVASTDPEKMYEDCAEVAKSLLGVTSKGNRPAGQSSYSSSSYGSGKDFTEDAWGINMKMIWVEGGEFMMGCTSEQSGNCEYNEQNVRRTTVDGYYIGMIEVTQSQWEKVMGTTIYQLWDQWIYQWHVKWNSTQYYRPFNSQPSRGVGPDYPVYCVTWEDAMSFCSKLSAKTGKTYTLPTEAQWEYAARGGNKPDGTKYAGSNVIDVVAWYEDNSDHETHPCGTKRPNSLGIYDMSGNVGEWCKDWYAETYRSSDTNNPTGASSGGTRVNRGGGWGIYAANCRVTHRDADDPYQRHRNLGFRVVLIP